MSDGDDVRQLERNLVALGHDPDGDITVDDDVGLGDDRRGLRFQDERGLDEDGDADARRGRLPPGRDADRRGAGGGRRAGRAGADAGRVSSTRREVTVDLDATRQSLARAGDVVTVELPTGRTARGRVTDVGKVAEQPAGEEEGEPTIEVTIALRGKAARGRGPRPGAGRRRLRGRAAREAS